MNISGKEVAIAIIIKPAVNSVILKNRAIFSSILTKRAPEPNKTKQDKTKKSKLSIIFYLLFLNYLLILDLAYLNISPKIRIDEDTRNINANSLKDSAVVPKNFCKKESLTISICKANEIIIAEKSHTLGFSL